jgi:hypothetical protein
MANPKISWQVFEDEYDEYIPVRSYTDEGSYTNGQTIHKRIRVWNNYAGIQNVNDIKDCNLILAFKNFEDNFLLHLINVRINGGEFVPPLIDTDKGVIELGDLSGLANDGSTANSSNFYDIEFKIGPLPFNMRCELKSLYFYLEYKEE